MGKLSKSYHYANQAYIGGGFNGGIHNCLEAAVYGIPVSFYGEDYVKYNEAVDLINLQAAVNVNSVGELRSVWHNFFEKQNQSNELSEKLKDYFSLHANVTQRILQHIQF
jgi:3-deoxy-D-manno-octulosonic-acid transferase